MRLEVEDLKKELTKYDDQLAAVDEAIAGFEEKVKEVEEKAKDTKVFNRCHICIEDKCLPFVLFYPTLMYIP